MSKRYTITSALPYANGPVHIGHLAGVYVPADIYTRYLRMKGADVLHICGSDEHGVAITLRAKKDGVTPQQVVDQYHNMIKSSFAEFGIAFDHYSRTSSKGHAQTAQSFFKEMDESGEFVVQESEQYFDEQEQQFLADRYIMGTCPNCGFEEAYGDQCENCGTSLSPEELKNPKSRLSGNAPIKKTTKHWYLPLDKYQETFLNDWIGTKKGIWRANVYGQCKSWLDQGLAPRAITRDLDWGIPVPAEGGEGKVLYVWFDAPIGYISATKEYFEEKGDSDAWKAYWQDKETELVHFIGKDNIVFHCIIFPAILKAHGGYVLPTQVPSNEFLNLEGNKISTSRNWAVWLHEYLEDFPGKQDVLRYVLTANAPEAKDNDFTWKDFQTRNNSELVAIFGNFVNRVVVLTNKYYDGALPPCSLDDLSEEDHELVKYLMDRPEAIANSLDKYRFREALQEMMNLARAGNKYLADQEPWKLVKTDEKRTEVVMHVALQVAAALAVVAEPFLPHTAAKLRDMLHMGDVQWGDVKAAPMLPQGHTIGKAELLFEKIEDSAIEAQIEKLQATKAANDAEKSNIMPQKDNVTFDDFTKLDLRVAKVLEAERVPKTDKLLKLQVDTGVDKRTVVSGIAEFFAPEDLVGKQVVMVLNLAPRKIRGVESQGMILMAENPEGQLVAVSPQNEMEPGSIVS
ncbi:methionine--tRNA ligase [Cryomorphaceae bacterium]|nr:methionine--tRNA ligase [Cryomorphaceae bacterium]